MSARSKEAAQEGDATTVCERAQASNQPAEQGRGTARTARSPQTPAGQVVEGENVTPGFKDKTECITICMTGLSFIYIETL